MMQALDTPQGFELTHKTRARPEDIWSIWMEVAGWPAWDTELLRGELHGSKGLGARGRLRARGAPWSQFRVTVSEPLKRHVLEIGLPQSRLRIERSLSAQDDGVVFKHQVSFVGALGLLFRVLLGNRYRRALPGAMSRLAALAEGRI